MRLFIVLLFSLIIIGCKSENGESILQSSATVVDPCIGGCLNTSAIPGKLFIQVPTRIIEKTGSKSFDISGVCDDAFYIDPTVQDNTKFLNRIYVFINDIELSPGIFTTSNINSAPSYISNYADSLSGFLMCKKGRYSAKIILDKPVASLKLTLKLYGFTTLTAKEASRTEAQAKLNGGMTGLTDFAVQTIDVFFAN